MNQDINLDNYTYDLPDERIAKFPLVERSSSKLLVYKNRRIDHKNFSGIGGLLPKESLLIFNDTRVIPARIHFFKETGARIEILLLDPVAPSSVVSQAMEAKGECVWHCMIGNRKKWHDGPLIKAIHFKGKEVLLSAQLIDPDKQLIQFTWNANCLFIDIVNAVGQMPLPPYLNREAVDADYQTYQTVYSKQEGAVAAPTAGLHFTHQIIDELKLSGHKTDYLTLHVGAGTFRPIKAKRIKDHEMHKEQIVITKQNVLNLIQHQGKIVPVGTTSMRTLESLYWIGVKLLENPDEDFSIHQADPYTLRREVLPSKIVALEAVLDVMNENQIDTIISDTAIFIYPGYQFKMCDALITNFHQPGSTLILLVAAFISGDWQKVYKEALEGGYRFLSYGDSSLLIP